MAKTKKDVIKFLVQYQGLKRLVSQNNVKKILAGNANFSGYMAESDLNALKAAQRYVEYVGKNVKVGNENLDQYFNRLQSVYTGGDTSKRVSIHDANYPAYVAEILATDKLDGQARIAEAMVANEEIEKTISNLPLALGKEKGLSYVAVMTHYLALGASVAGLNGNLTEAIGATQREKERNKRLSEIIAERNKRLQELEKIDGELLGLMEQSKKNASQESVDLGFTAISTEIAQMREAVIKAIEDGIAKTPTGVAKGEEKTQAGLLSRINKVDGNVKNGFQDLSNQMYDSQALILTAVEHQGETGRKKTEDEAVATRTHITNETNRILNAVNNQAQQTQPKASKGKIWARVVAGGLALAILFGAGLGIGYGLGAGQNSNDVPPATGDEPPTVIVDDGGYKDRYNTLFDGITFDVDHYNQFKSGVDAAKGDNVISRDEYAGFVTKMGEDVKTTQFPRQEMESVYLDNAIYETELAQYDAVREMVENRFADKNFTAEEQAEVQAIIDGYNAENIEGKFNSATLMAATVETAKEYSELNILYNNLLNAQPGTPAPNYEADMTSAMTTLQTALSDNTLTEAEVQALDAIIARLDATGDDDAELFAEKLDSVIDSFVAQQVVNAQLTNDKATAEGERDEAIADKNQAESERDEAIADKNQAESERDEAIADKEEAEDARDEYKDLYEDALKTAESLQKTVNDLSAKVTELENTIKTNAADAAKKYSDLETLYKAAIIDYNKLYEDYEKLLEENARIPVLEQQLVDAANTISSLQNSIAQSQDVILEYYYKHTGKNGTLEEALAYFESVTNTQGNQQGSSSADPEEPSYQP